MVLAFVVVVQPLVWGFLFQNILEVSIFFEFFEVLLRWRFWVKSSKNCFSIWNCKIIQTHMSHFVCTIYFWMWKNSAKTLCFILTFMYKNYVPYRNFDLKNWFAYFSMYSWKLKNDGKSIFLVKISLSSNCSIVHMLF